MEKQGTRTISVFSLLFSLLFILVSLSCSLAAEFLKAKEKDLKVEGTLCSLPKTPSFSLGLAALVSLSLAQIIGTYLSRRQKPHIALVALSWGSFGIACILLGTGTSMSKGQDYGRGWLDGRCYLVRSGVYGAAGALGVLSGGQLLNSFGRRQKESDQSKP